MVQVRSLTQTVNASGTDWRNTTGRQRELNWRSPNNKSPKNSVPQTIQSPVMAGYAMRHKTPCSCRSRLGLDPTETCLFSARIAGLTWGLYSAAACSFLVLGIDLPALVKAPYSIESSPWSRRRLPYLYITSCCQNNRLITAMIMGSSWKHSLYVQKYWIVYLDASKTNSGAMSTCIVCIPKVCLLSTAITTTAASAYTVTAANNVLRNVSQTETLTVNAWIWPSFEIHDIGVSWGGIYVCLTPRARCIVPPYSNRGAIRATHITSVYAQ